jgi:hypothetical protein
MRAPEFQPLAAGVAAIMLIASIVWWLTSAPQLIDPGEPTWKGANVVRLNAAVPQIADFKEFYTNNQNPFVPLNDRGPEDEAQDPDNRRRRRDPPPTPPPIPPPREPVIVKVPDPPPPRVLVLPTLVPAPSNAPLTYGLVSIDGNDAVIVRMPGATEPTTLKPGNKAGGWTLVSIDEGNFATFVDPDGVEQRFVIGEGDLAVFNSNAAASGVTKEPKGHGAPMPPKPVGSGPRPGSKPGANNGPIPKPPMREERRPPSKETPQKAPPSKQPPPKK